MTTITLPIRTVSEANRRDHWAKKAKRAGAQRGLVYLACAFRWASANRGLAKGDAPVSCSLTRIAPRELDDDNLRGALKAVRDGVADALGVNDNDPRVTWKYAQRRGKPREYAVEIHMDRRTQ